MGHIHIDANDCFDEAAHMTEQDGILPGTRLERNFEPVEDAPKLSFSYKISMIALDNIFKGTSKGDVDPMVIYDVTRQLTIENPIKIDALRFCGTQFMQIFDMTENERDIRAVVKAYEDAAGSSSTDDRRFIAYTNDVGLIYSKCYKSFGKAEGAEAGISAWRHALAMVQEGHADTPKLLPNLGGLFSDRFKTTGALEHISETVDVFLRSRHDPCTSKKGVLLVSQADTPGLPKCPCTSVEVRKTQEQLDKGRIQSALYNGDEATTNVISEARGSYSCIHLACHAPQQITNPLQSGIHLHDGPLKLSEIMKKNLPDVDLAFMSACQTSVGDEKLSEEVVHLAAGMLAAGYRSVVATMWSISDQHAPQVAERFYESLLSSDASEGGASFRLDGRQAARVLHTTTRRLREKLGNSNDALLAWIPYIHVGV